MNLSARQLLWGVGLMLALGQIDASARQLTIQLKDHGIRPNQKELNVSALLPKVLAEAQASQQKGDTLTLFFEVGDYHFSAEGAPQKQVYISNHDQLEPPRSFGMLIEDARNLRIVAPKGTNFYFHDRMLPIGVINSENIHLEGFEIDYPNPQITQVTVKENKGKEGIIFEPAPWAKYKLENNVFVAYGNNWENRPLTGMAFRPGYKDIVYRTADLNIPLKEVKDLGHNHLLAPHWVNDKLPKGTIVALRSYYRPNPAIFLDNNLCVQLQDVKVHYAEGMGVLAQNSTDISLHGFEVALRHEWANHPGVPYHDPRYFTTQADATHFVACKGLIDVRNGLFESMMDDAINVHGIYLKVSKRIDSYTIQADYMHGQAWGFEWAKAGEVGQFVTSKTMELVGEQNTITSIKPVGSTSNLGAKGFVIRFKNKLPKDLKPATDICVENLSRTPDINFVGNTIRHNRARGTLFNSAGHILVEDNKFQLISGAAILVCSDASGWYESGRTRSLVIRKNLFLDVLTSLFQFTEAVITISPNIPELDKQKVPFYGDGKAGILIEDNVFETFDTPLLHALSVDGLVFRNNVLKETNTYPKYHWNQHQFFFKGCKNIQADKPATL